MIGDEEMPKIIWKGIIKSENDFPTADIPKSAKKLDSEEDMKKMQIKAYLLWYHLFYFALYVCL